MGVPHFDKYPCLRRVCDAYDMSCYGHHHACGCCEYLLPNHLVTLRCASQFGTCPCTPALVSGGKGDWALVTRDPARSIGGLVQDPTLPEANMEAPRTPLGVDSIWSLTSSRVTGRTRFGTLFYCAESRS